VVALPFVLLPAWRPAAPGWAEVARWDRPWARGGGDALVAAGISSSACCRLGRLPHGERRDLRASATETVQWFTATKPDGTWLYLTTPGPTRRRDPTWPAMPGCRWASTRPLPPGSRARQTADRGVEGARPADRTGRLGRHAVNGYLTSGATAPWPAWSSGGRHRRRPLRRADGRAGRFLVAQTEPSGPCSPADPAPGAVAGEYSSTTRASCWLCPDAAVPGRAVERRPTDRRYSPPGATTPRTAAAGAGPLGRLRAGGTVAFDDRAGDRPSPTTSWPAAPGRPVRCPGAVGRPAVRPLGLLVRGRRCGAEGTA
jgi:hypothetical protein